jgi:hypothetical protein
MYLENKFSEMTAKKEKEEKRSQLA